MYCVIKTNNKLGGKIMDILKRKAIEEIVDASITNFVNGFELRYTRDLNNPNGVINQKKNNCFIAELGVEFVFYSAFVRSFDSSFGNVLENMGNNIARLSYEVRGTIKSFLLPQQTQAMDYIITEYERHTKPEVKDYSDVHVMIPTDTRSYMKDHATDNYFFNPDTKEHFIIELKAGGDLDVKKAKAEKIALLQEYFMLKNSFLDCPDHTIKLFFGTAYNMYGEGNDWRQERVKQFFAEEELLIGKDYWNFVCNDLEGFNIIFTQYQKSCQKIRDALYRIKNIYIS